MCAGFQQLLVIHMPRTSDERDALVLRIRDIKEDSLQATTHVLQIIHAQVADGVVDASAMHTTTRDATPPSAYTKHADVVVVLLLLQF